MISRLYDIHGTADPVQVAQTNFDILSEDIYSFSGIENLGWYGAVGDGVADDTDAFQAALTASAGKTLIIPDGTYLITSQLTVPSSIKITGQVTSIIQGDDSFEVLFSVNTKTDVTFSGFTINGGCSVGIYLTGSSNVTIKGMKIIGCDRARDTLYTSGVLLHTSANCKILNNKFSANGNNIGAGQPVSGTIIFRDSATDCTGIEIAGNYIENTGLHAVGGFDMSFCFIHDNYIDQGNVGNSDNENGYGIILYDAQHSGGGRNYVIGNVVSGNRVVNCYGSGIYLVVGKHNIIIGNTVKSAALTMNSASLIQGGIVVNESQHTAVTGNTVDTTGAAQTNTTVGIGTAAGISDIIQGNSISNVIPSAKGYGIWCGGVGVVVTNSTSISVQGNTVLSTGNAGIAFDGSGDHFECLVIGNNVTTSGGIGISLDRIQRSKISHNIIRDWGSTTHGLFLGTTSPGSPRNVISDNVILNQTALCSGHGISIRSANNIIRNNFVFSTPTLVVGFFDNIGSNIWDGNTHAGTISTPYSFSSAAFLASDRIAISTKTTTYTTTVNDHTILCDTSGAGFTVTLHSASSALGQVVVIKKVSADGNTLTIEGNGDETIDGDLNKTTTTQWESFKMQSNGSVWFLI